MSTDHAREIAERVARRVAYEPAAKPQPNQNKGAVSSELEAVRSTLTELQRKLAQLEAQVEPESPTNLSLSNTQAPPATTLRTQLSTHSPWLAGINAPYSHPSEEKFGVEEAVVTELVDFFENEKKCSIEPGGKPCDHCAMCSSRGF